MNYTYLYDFNQKRYQNLDEQTLLYKETLSFEVVKYGYLLPKRLARGFLFGNGGVLDAHKQYVESSQMNAYVLFYYIIANLWKDLFKTIK